MTKKKTIKAYGICDKDYGQLQLSTLRRTKKEVMEDYHMPKKEVVSCEIKILNK